MNKGIKILFVAGFGPVTRTHDTSASLYRDTLGIDFKEEEGGYLHTSALKGANAFALWPLSQAAESCFGTDRWPEDVPTPHAWLEFDVEDVSQATDTLKGLGYQLLVSDRKEPWGQTVTRFLSPEGILLGLTETPWMRKERQE